MTDVPTRCWYCERALAIESIRIECAYCGADVGRVYEWLDAIAAARAEAEPLRDENERLYRRIERLEAKVARQRVMLTRLQAAIERRATGDWVEATRRAMADEVVERHVREADVALDEAERWRQKYEALRAGVERVIQDLHEEGLTAFRRAHDTTHPYHDGASDAYYEAAQMVRRLLTEAGGGSQ